MAAMEDLASLLRRGGAEDPEREAERLLRAFAALAAAAREAATIETHAAPPQDSREPAEAAP